MKPTIYRSAAISLALAAMLLRAVLPDCWMPSGTTTPFTICSVAGAHHGTNGPIQPGQERTHAPCAFAAAAPLSPPPTPSLIFRLPIDATQLTAIFVDDALGSASRHRPNAARAPPAFA